MIIMKKVIFYSFITILLCILGYVFRDSLFQKGLDTDEIPYNEITTATTKDKYNIYLFYNDGDSQSELLKSYFYTLDSKITEDFTLYTFEVSSSEENKLLLSNVKSLLNITDDVIPCLVIGNEVLLGYTENDNVKINTYIEEETKKEIHYDVLEYVKVEQES